jgi:hypothetical protein
MRPSIFGDGARHPNNVGAKLPYLPTELWCTIISFNDPLPNYYFLRPTNKFFKILVEDDFKRRFSHLLTGSTLVFVRPHTTRNFCPNHGCPCRTPSTRSECFALFPFYSLDGDHLKTRAIFRQENKSTWLDLRGVTANPKGLGVSDAPELKLKLSDEAMKNTWWRKYCYHMVNALLYKLIDEERGEVSVEWIPMVVAMMRHDEWLKNKLLRLDL